MTPTELMQLGWTRRGAVWVAPPGTIPEPKTADLADYKRPAADSVRQLAPCGTSAAYRRHRRAGETCDRCEAHKAVNATRAGTR